MTEQESESKDSISISLPRSFYDFYMANQLYKEYSSFSDWVRDAVRKDRENWRIRRYSERVQDEGPTISRVD